MDKLNQGEVITYQYLTDEKPTPVHVVFLGIDFGSADGDCTIYYRYDGNKIIVIDKDEYVELTS